MRGGSIILSATRVRVNWRLKGTVFRSSIRGRGESHGYIVQRAGSGKVGQHIASGTIVLEVFILQRDGKFFTRGEVDDCFLGQGL